MAEDFLIGRNYINNYRTVVKAFLRIFVIKGLHVQILSITVNFKFDITSACCSQTFIQNGLDIIGSRFRQFLVVIIFTNDVGMAMNNNFGAFRNLWNDNICLLYTSDAA